MDAVNGLMSFIDRVPTAFHAVDEIAASLDAAGYARLQETDRWPIAPGGRYYVTRNQSSLIAFRLPASGVGHFQIVASHGDSPSFKLKPAFARTGEGCALLNVEKYGGMLMSTWMDRPLSVAGRLIVDGPGGLRARLVNVDRDLALIPNLPIHFNRDANDGVALNAQVDMLPVVGMEGVDFAAAVAAAARVEPDRVVGADLFLYNRQRAVRFGVDGAFIAAPRLDDLECVYASLTAFLGAKGGAHTDVMCVLDNEEVGSGTRQGAASPFLIETLRRVTAALDGNPQALEAALAASFMVSADNAHAAHPNHPDKYDKDNRVRMNGGVVIKSNASQKYATDGLSAAAFEHVCISAGVPVQRFSNRSDIAGGSTLGNIALTRVSMPAVDIGLAQLAMHSACETAGAQDIGHMVRAMEAFYNAEIAVKADGAIEIR